MWLAPPVSGRVSLAVSYLDAGRVAEAISLLEQIVAAREPLPGAGHLSSTQSQSWRVKLAVFYLDAGRVAEATSLLEQILAARERPPGGGPTRTLASRNNLASACQAGAAPPDEIGEPDGRYRPPDRS